MSTPNVDALRVLRSTLASKAQIHLLPDASPTATPVYSLSECSHLSFPASDGSEQRIILAKNTPTRFKRAPQSAASEVWDLQSLLLCYLRKDASIAEYAQEAVREGCELVGIMQRKIVADYLEGKDAGQAAPYLVPDGQDGAAALGTASDPNKLQDTSVESTLARAADENVAPDARPAKKARYVVNKEDLEAYKRIVKLWEVNETADRTSVLRGNGKKGNFAPVRDMIAERLKAGKEEMRKGGQPVAATAPAIPSQVSKRRRQMNPIIIISPSSSALLTMYNIKRFLEESIFEPSDVARAQEGRIAEDVVHVNHRRQIGALSGDAASAAAHGGGLAGANRAERAAAGEKLVKYFVVDGVDALSKFGDDAWDRVVCVMTTGQEWQFRPYKWTEPKELFHHVKGIYPKWVNEPSNPKIASWNVTELRIDPSKRHLDKSAVSDFWRSLEAWTSTHKQGVVDF